MSFDGPPQPLLTFSRAAHLFLQLLLGRSFRKLLRAPGETMSFSSALLTRCAFTVFGSEVPAESFTKDNCWPSHRPSREADRDKLWLPFLCLSIVTIYSNRNHLSILLDTVLLKHYISCYYEAQESSDELVCPHLRDHPARQIEAKPLQINGSRVTASNPFCNPTIAWHNCAPRSVICHFLHFDHILSDTIR